MGQEDFRKNLGRLQEDFRMTSGRLQEDFLREDFRPEYDDDRMTSGRLQEDFRKSGRLQEDFRKILTFIFYAQTHFKSTQRGLSKHSESNQTTSCRRSLKYFVLLSLTFSL